MTDPEASDDDRADSAADSWSAWPGSWVPDNEIPVALPWSGVLGRSEEYAVALLGAQLYTSVIELQIIVCSRRDSPELFNEVAGAVHGGVTDRLLLGVEYSDGRRGTNVGTSTPEHNTPTLNSYGSGGGPRKVHAAYLLAPPPPPGPVTVLCAWPARGISETTTVLDASDITVFLEQVQLLWPRQPDQPSTATEVPPTVPAGGWFAHTLQLTPAADRTGQGPARRYAS
jgi:hypothetical protein